MNFIPYTNNVLISGHLACRLFLTQRRLDLTDCVAYYFSQKCLTEIYATRLKIFLKRGQNVIEYITNRLDCGDWNP